MTPFLLPYQADLRNEQWSGVWICQLAVNEIVPKHAEALPALSKNTEAN